MYILFNILWELRDTFKQLDFRFNLLSLFFFPSDHLKNLHASMVFLILEALENEWTIQAIKVFGVNYKIEDSFKTRVLVTDQ